MSNDSFEEHSPAQLRQRLWGAAVLIAIAIIVLPLILDGAGSESQFRRVERLRQEPPAAERKIATSASGQLPEMSAVTRQDADGVTSSSEIVDQVIDDLPSDASSVDAVRAEREVRKELSSATRPSLTAWVVQAAAFIDESDALLVRDQLRRAGFASFVRDRDAATDPYRVLVGPMIKQKTAEKARKNVAALLQNDPILMSYP